MGEKFYNGSWFWLLLSGIILLVLFFLTYIDEKFSRTSILLLISAIFLFLLAGFTGLISRFGRDVKRINNLFGEEIVGRIDTQRRMISATLDALQKAGNTGVKMTNATFDAIPYGVKTGGKRFASNVGSTLNVLG